MRLARLAMAGMLALAAASAATLGQIDDFEDGTTQGWHINSLGFGGGTGPQNIATGGPGGANDNYMLMTAIGGSAGGSRLNVNNFFAQWSGNYTASGIVAISMDLRNFNSVDLNIHLLLENPQVGPPTDVGRTAGFILPAGGGWVHAIFNVSTAGLTMAQGDAATLLSGVTGLRIYHSTPGVHPGEAIVATLGVDNITAQTPEPSTMALAGIGLLAAALLRSRR